MLVTNVLTIAALATSAMAGYAGGHTAYAGSKVSTGEHKPEHHWAAREAHEALKHPAPPADADPRPAEAHDGTHERHGDKLDRRNGGVYWCTKNNYKGVCTKSPADNTCHEWKTQIEGSFGPDPGVKCTFFEKSNCSGDTDVVYYPGTKQVTYQVWGKNGLVNYPTAWRCQN